MFRVREKVLLNALFVGDLCDNVSDNPLRHNIFGKILHSTLTLTFYQDKKSLACIQNGCPHCSHSIHTQAFVLFLLAMFPWDMTRKHSSRRSSN